MEPCRGDSEQNDGENQAPHSRLPWRVDQASKMGRLCFRIFSWGKENGFVQAAVMMASLQKREVRGDQATRPNPLPIVARRIERWRNMRNVTTNTNSIRGNS